MPINAVWVNIHGDRVVRCVDEAVQNLESGRGEVVLDFSSVRRIDANALNAMERLAGAAEGKAVKIALHGVNIDVYKVLKQMNLAARFTFLT
jgi:anti-anti-sigma regulatory factor